MNLSLRSLWHSKPYCCENFRRLTEDTADRGLSIAIERLDSGDKIVTKFYFQMRSITVEDERRTRKGNTEVWPASVTIWTRVLIKYCPSCGKQLSKLAKAHPIIYSDLAYNHAKFHENFPRDARRV